MSTSWRSALVYAVATVLTAQVSCDLYLLSPESGSASLAMLGASLCGLPALAFVGGYSAIAILGRSGQPSDRGSEIQSHRVGAVIRFGGTWLGWALLLLIAALM